MQDDNIISRIIVVGATRLFTYCLSEELGEIKETKEKNITRVISWREPMLTHIRSEMYSNNGEAWTNPIIKGGMVSG